METSQDFNRLAEELYAAQATEVDIIITTALIPGKPAPKLISAAMVATMETSQDFNRLAEELYAAQATEVDIIITTALIPGKPAPKLISAAMVATMKPGSVIVDMAAANGGNCELSRPDELVMSDNGVRIIGYTDLPGRLPTQSSQLFGTNIVNLMKLLTPGKDGQIVLDFDDVVQRGMTVVREGEKTWPPPPVQVSAQPAVVAAPVAVKPEPKPKDPRRRYAYMVLAALVFPVSYTHLT